VYVLFISNVHVYSNPYFAIKPIGKTSPYCSIADLISRI